MGAMFPDGGHEQGQEGEGDDGQVIYLSYSRNEVRNQVNGGKGIKSRQSRRTSLRLVNRRGSPSRLRK